jgi:hypothetical protein
MERKRKRDDGINTDRDRYNFWREGEREKYKQRDTEIQ